MATIICASENFERSKRIGKRLVCLRMKEICSLCALVVDDSPLILLHACMILEDAGYFVLSASSGDDAVAILSEQAGKINLLFSDVQMPGHLDGFGLAHHAASEYPEIEIVITSGHVEPGISELPAQASFLPKPFDERIVHEHLCRMLPEASKPEVLKLRQERGSWH